MAERFVESFLYNILLFFQHIFYLDYFPVNLIVTYIILTVEDSLRVKLFQEQSRELAPSIHFVGAKSEKIGAEPQIKIEKRNINKKETILIKLKCIYLLMWRP